MTTARHALYFTPEDGTALAAFGWSWLGREPRSANCPPLADDRQDLVAAPRSYGFHATLKPPFRLAEGREEAELTEAVAAFAAARAPFVEPPLILAALGGFVALRPSTDAPRIHALADDCVRAFDRFRAPPSAAEAAKRGAAPLTERQRALLDRWGYPYVFEEYRFHMTLTGTLAEDERAAALARIAPLAAGALAEPVAVRSLCLFRQEAAGQPFVLAARFPFGG